MYVDKRGGYSKRRDRITAPVTRIPEGTVAAPRKKPEPDSLVPRPHEGSSGVMFVNKTTGAAIASLLVLLLVGITYVGSTFFTRELQFDHLRDQQRQMQRELENLRTKNQELERRMVQVATHVENMEDAGG